MKFTGYTGDPFSSCRKFTREDLCQPNPCGDGATCQVNNYAIKILSLAFQTFSTHSSDFKKYGIYSLLILQPGIDLSRSDRPVCTCPPGTRGDPLRKCTKGN